jgi:arginine:ornithine antiporter/lysine permease
MARKETKLGLSSLIALGVGSMIGTGLFDLPQNISCHTAVPALLIAWSITFVGMFCLTYVFQNLSRRRADLDVGIYSYARAALGDYVGFNSAWGYWISAWVGNTGYTIMLGAATSLFIPQFGNGTTLVALITNSIIVWAAVYLCLRGIKTATVTNLIITILKLILIIIFIVIISYYFKPSIFIANLSSSYSLGPIVNQIKNMMLVTVWVFIGIEGATIFSARAQQRTDIGKATVISFFLMFILLFAISILPFGVLPQQTLATLTTPSTGTLLAYVTGNWGNVFINIALIIAILGAFLSWMLIATEVPYTAGKKDKLFPALFTLESNNNFPRGSLIITASCQQLYLIFAYFYHTGYLPTIFLAAAMIIPPYLFAASYALILALSGKTYEKDSNNIRYYDLFLSATAVIYGLWLLYAAGKYLFLSSILYAIGTIFFISNKKKRQQKIFHRYEWLLFLLLITLSIFSIITIITNKITLN